MTNVAAFPAGAQDDLTALPHDLHAEAYVLGAMLISADACSDAFATLTAQHFYSPLNGQLFNLARDLYLAGSPVDPITLNNAARAHRLHKAVDNGAYIAELIAIPASPHNLHYYAKLIKEKALLRALATATLRGYHSAIDPAADGVTTPSDILAHIMQAAQEEGASSSEHVTTAGDAATFALDFLASQRDSTAPRISTGYPDVDALIHHITPGQLILVAARPSVGKTIALLDICRHVAVAQQQPVLLHSLEMSTWEIGLRLLAAHTGIRLNAIRDSNLTEQQWNTLARGLEELHASPLHIDTNPHATVADIKARAIRQQRETGLALIVIDYLGLITPTTQRRDQHVEVSEISRNLKILAKDVAPVVAAAQLNRNPESRADKRPMLADLRSSGSLEQDSDVVVLLHREDVYDLNSPRAGEVDMIVAKNRGGATGTATLATQLDRTRFVSLYGGI